MSDGKVKDIDLYKLKNGDIKFENKFLLMLADRVRKTLDGESGNCITFWSCDSKGSRGRIKIKIEKDQE
jgi:hypothetical protein